MSASIPESLEKQRLRLEDSLTKLRKALKHWQIYSAEYEAFREELQTLPADASRDAMLAAGVETEGTVVDEKEIKTLLGDNFGIQRTVAQVIAAVGHRIDYVQDNVSKVEKQIEVCNRKLDSLQAVNEDLLIEDGLPMMEIHEELDDDNNVINATTRAVSTTALKSFEKGINEEEAKLAAEKKSAVKEEGVKKEGNKAPKRPVETSPQGTSPAPPAKVKVAEKSARPMGGIANGGDLEEGGGIVKIVDDFVPDTTAKEDLVKEVPGETQEEAELRRQMLKYNMQEIGAVVAELNLDEEGVYYGYEDDSGEDDDDDEDEEEDEYGRTTTRVITEEYRREMEELARRIKERGEAARAAEANLRKEEKAAPPPKKKKGVRFAEELDVSPAPLSFPEPPSAKNEEDAIPLLVDLLEMDQRAKAKAVAKAQAAAAAVPEAPATPKEKRQSLFKSERAAAIHVASPATPIVEPPVEQKVPVLALKTEVLERSPAAASVPAEPPSLQPKKISRFKAAKLASAATSSEVDNTEGVSKPTLSNSIVERPVPKNVSIEPPDELDPNFLRREVATDFHRLRTRMIQREGGFVESEEEMARVPLDENGERRKVSRFKAARIKGLQLAEP